MSDYPRLKKLGVTFHDRGILCSELDEKLKEAGMDTEQFNELFGVQTCPVIEIDGEECHGVYPWDAEAVLERMISGKRTGTQLFWD